MSNGSKSRNSLVSFVRNYREAARQESMKQRRKQAFQPMLDDNLEERRLMAVTSSITGTTLNITSTAPEPISLFYDGATMTVNGAQPTGATGNAFDTILINTTNSGQRIVNFTGSSVIDGQGLPIANITGAGAGTFRVNQLTQLISFTASPTVALNASVVSVSNTASINQAVMLGGSGSLIVPLPGTFTESVIINKNITLQVGGSTTGAVTLVAPTSSSAIRIDSGSLVISTPFDLNNNPPVWTTSFILAGAGPNTTGIELNGGGVSYTDSATTNLTFAPSLTQAYKVSAGSLTINTNRTNSGILVSGGSATINSGINLSGNVSVTSGTFTNNGTLTGTYTQSSGTGTNNGTITGAINFSGGSLSLTPTSVQTGDLSVTGGTLNVNVSLANLSVGGSGAVNVQGSGNVSNSLIGQGGNLSIATGGRVSGLVVNGTTAVSCGTIAGPVTVSAGSLTLNTGSTQAGNFMVSGGALTSNATIGGTLGVSAGTATIQSGGAVSGTSTVSGTGTLNSAGSLNTLNVTAPGALANLTAGSAGTVSVTDGNLISAINLPALNVTSPGTANITAGTVANTTSNGTLLTAGTLSNVTVSGGSIAVRAGLANVTAGSATSATVTGGTLISAATLTSLDVSGTGTANVVAGGVAGTANSSATLNVSAGSITILNVTNGTTTVSGGSVTGLTSLSVGNLNQTGGSLTGLTVNSGTANLTSGNVTGVVTVNGGTLLTSGGSNLSSTINVNNGTTSLGGTQSGPLNVNGASADVTILSPIAGLTTVTLSNSTTISSSTGNLTLNGAGANVTIGSGSYSIGATTISAATSLTVPAATTLASLTASDGTTTVHGAVTGTSTVSGTAGLTSNGTLGALVVNAGTVSLTGGTVANLTQSNGTVNSAANITGFAALNGGTTTITGIVGGTTTVNGGALTSNGSLQAVDVQAGTATLTGGTAVSLTQSNGTVTSAANITGFATLTGGTTTITGIVGGLTTVSNGTLTSNGSLNGGLTVNSGTAAILTGGTTTVLTQSGGTVTSAGDITTSANLTGGTTGISGNVTGLTVNGGTATVNGTIVSLTALSNGTLNLLSNQTLNISALNSSTLNVNATVTGDVTSEDSSVVNINGVAGTVTGLLLSNGTGTGYQVNVLNGATVGNVTATTGDVNLVAGTTANVLTLNGDAFVQSHGTVANLTAIGGPGHINVYGNVMGLTTISGNAALSVLGGQLTGGLTANGSGVIDNSGTISGNTAISGSTQFDNYGAGGTVANLVLSGSAAANFTAGSATRVDVQAGATLLGNASASFGTVVVSGGTATLTGSNIISGANVTAGTLSTSGNITGGLVVATGSTASIRTGSTVDTVTSNGTLNVNGTVSGASTVIGGTSTVQTAGVLSGPVNANGGTLNILNGGTISALRVNTGSTVNSCGTINGNVTNIAGAVTLNNTSTQAGNFSVETGGSLTVNSTLAGTLDVYNGTASVLTSGVVSSCTTVSGTASLVSSGSLQRVIVNSGTANLSGGTATRLDQNAGTVTSAANITGVVNLNGGNTTITRNGIVGGTTGVNGGNLTSSGTLQEVSVYNGTVALTGGTATSLIQQTGYVSTVTSAANITGNVDLNSGNTTITGIVGGVTTVNAGNLTATGATLNNVTLTTGTAVLTSGTAGTITQTGGTLTSSTVASGSLNITGGNATVSGGSIAGLTTVNNGTSTLAVSNGTLTDLTLVSGTANVSGGSVSGTVTTNATLNISNGTVAALIVNTGTTAVTGGTISGAINVNGGRASFNGTQSGTLGVGGATADVTILSPIAGSTTVTLSNSTTINSSTGPLTVTGANANVTIGSGTYTIGNTTVTSSTLTIPANTTVGALTASNSTVVFNGAAASIVNDGTIALNGAVAGATTLNGGAANLTGGNYTGGIQLNAGSLQTNAGNSFIGNINTVSANQTTLILPTSGSATQTGNLTLGANTTTNVVIFNSNGNPGGPAALGSLSSSGNVVLNGSVAMTAFNLGTGQFPNNTTILPFLRGANVSGSFSNGSLTYQGAITFTLASNSTQAYLTNTTISGIYVSPNIANTGDGNLTYFNVAGSNTTGVYGITAFSSLAAYQASSYATAPVTLTLGNGTTGDLSAVLPGADLSIYLKAIGTGTTPVQSNAPISLSLGNLALNLGDTLNISFFGANTSISTSNLVIAGTSNISGANLALTNVGSLANTPAYTALTIIDQTTANVIGDFNPGIYNRTVGGVLFYGFTGYGNEGSAVRDVTFVQAPAQGTLSTVKVNDNWTGAGYANGTVINANEIVGINMAGNIGAGLSALATPSVAGNSSLVLYNGTYAGDLNLSAYTGANNLTVSVAPDAGSTYGTVNLSRGNVTLASNVTLALDHGANSSATDILQANGTVTLAGNLNYAGPSVADYTVFQPVRTTNNSSLVGAFNNAAFGGYGSGSINGYYVANSVTSQANPTDATTSVMSLIRVINPGNLTNAYVSSSFTATNGKDYLLPNSTLNTVVYGGINAFSTIDLGMGNIADSTSSNLVISNAITSVASANVTKSFDILFMNATGGNATGALQFGTLELNSNASPQLWDAGQVTANNIQLNAINGGTALGSYNVLGLATTSTSANITFGQPASSPGQTAFTSVAGSLIANRSGSNRLTIYGNDNNINASSGTGAIITFNASGSAILTVSQLNMSACLTANVTGINANAAAAATALLELDDIVILNLANKIPGMSVIPYAGNLTLGTGDLRLDITATPLNDFFTIEGNIAAANPSCATLAPVTGLISYSGFSACSTFGTIGTRGSLIYNQATTSSLVLRGGAGDDTFNFGSNLGKQAPTNPGSGAVLDVIGGDGNDNVCLTACGTSPSMITNYVGGLGNNTLRTLAPELFGDFQVTGPNAGQLIYSTTADFGTDTGTPVSFSQVGYLIGSDNNGTASASVTFDRFVLSQIQPTVVDGDATSSIQSIIGNPSATIVAPSYDQIILGANITSAGSINSNLSTWAQWNIETLDNGQGDAAGVNKVTGNVQVFNNLTTGSTTATAPIGFFSNVAKFTGGEENDIYNVSGSGKVGIKLIDGGAGTNSLELGTWDNLASATVGATVDLRLGWGTPINGGAIYSATANTGLANVNNVYGTNTNDTLYGNDLSNVLFGGPGNDSIYGYGGNDILIGDYGNDSLVGGNGNDFLTGDHVDFYFDIAGGDPVGVLPMEILLDVHQNRTVNPWKTATTSPTTFAAQSVALETLSASQTSNYGTMALKGLKGVATANGTDNAVTVFADYNLDTLTDTSGLNYLIYTAGVKNVQTGLLDSTANDYVPTSTIVTRRRYSRWNPWS